MTTAALVLASLAACETDLGSCPPGSDQPGEPGAACGGANGACADFTQACFVGDELARGGAEGVCRSLSLQRQGRDVVEARCTFCHSKSLEGVDRNGAPSGLDWDDLSTVREEAGEMFGETDEGAMPPEEYGASGMTVTDTAVTGQDLELMRIWLACGAKDVQR